jgi:quaternary ammonium compound-resistance protein SugE
MAWIYLFIAGLMEIGWPLGLKFSQTRDIHKFWWIAFAVLSMAASGVFLWLAQKSIPMGTAYAIWTGIGAVGAFVLGILLFRDPASFFRIASATLIVLGIVGLKLSAA